LSQQGVIIETIAAVIGLSINAIERLTVIIFRLGIYKVEY